MNANGKYSRRDFLRMGTMVAASGVLAACAPSSAPATSAPQEPTKETVAAKETAAIEATPAYEQGELSILLCCSGPDEQAGKERFNERFAESHPGVTVRQEPMPAGQNYFEKLQTVMAAGTAPDIYDMWEGYVQPYAKNGALLNLDPFFEQDTKLKREDLWPACLPQMSWEGSIYSLLIGIMPGPVSIFYNKKLLDEASMAAPTSDWTWDNLREAAIKLTKDTNNDGEPDQYGLVFANWFVPWLYWIWSNGGDVFNADETACAFTEPAAYQAVQYWADLVAKEKCAPNSSTLGAMQGPENMFKTNLVGLYLGNCWDLSMLKEAEAQGLQWGSCLAPKANNGNRVFYQHTWQWGIWTGTKKPNLAWEYCRNFVTEEQMLTDFNTWQKVIPGDKRQIKTFLTPETEALGWAGVVDTLGDTKKLRYPGAGAKWDKISSLFQAEIDLVFTGDKTAEQAAKDSCSTVNEELQRT